VKENKYDDPRFFEKYGQMARSQPGMRDELRRPMMLLVSAVKETSSEQEQG
jgi:hypothetical protein